jgi:alcohol dehydrogenase (cytochrome c)
VKFWLRTLLGTIVVVGIAIGGLAYAYWGRTVQIGSTAINYVRYWSAPAGTLETEFAPTGAATQPPTSTASAAAQAAPGGTEGRLAKLQQDAQLEPFLAVKYKRCEAQSTLHL